MFIILENTKHCFYPFSIQVLHFKVKGMKIVDNKLLNFKEKGSIRRLYFCFCCFTNFLQVMNRCNANQSTYTISLMDTSLMQLLLYARLNIVLIYKTIMFYDIYILLRTLLTTHSNNLASLRNVTINKILLYLL